MKYRIMYATVTEIEVDIETDKTPDELRRLDGESCTPQWAILARAQIASGKAWMRVLDTYVDLEAIQALNEPTTGEAS